MNISVNHILYFITVLFILAYLLKINRAIYYFIVSSMTVVFYLVSMDLTISICISGVITALIYVFLDREPLQPRKFKLFEHLTTEEESKKKEEPKKKEETPQMTHDDDHDENFEPASEHKVDQKNSYLELFKTLKPEEIGSLNTDTQQLIQTQRQLIETLQSMGPALKEGKTILDTFKNYFNDGGIDKLTI